MNIEKAKSFIDDEQLAMLKLAVRLKLNLAIVLDNQLDRVIERRKEVWQEVDQAQKQLKEYQLGRA
jgi:hypothetical protein